MTKTEIDKMFADHLDSLRVSGLPFDEVALHVEWAKALADAE